MSHPKSDLCNPNTCVDLDDLEGTIFGILEHVQKGSWDDARDALVRYLTSDQFFRDCATSNMYDKFHGVVPAEVYARLAGRSTTKGDTANRHIGAKHTPHVLGAMTLLLHLLTIIEGKGRKQCTDLKQRVAVLEGKLDRYAHPEKFLVEPSKLSSGNDEPCSGGHYTYIEPENGFVLVYCPIKVAPGKTMCEGCFEKEAGKELEKRRSEIAQEKEDLEKRLAKIKEEEALLAKKIPRAAGKWVKSPHGKK